MSIIWILAIIAFLALIIVKDKQIKKTPEYKVALQNSKKPPKKLFIKRWWTWAILIFLTVATFTAVSIEIDNADKAKKAQIAKSSTKKIDKKKNKQSEPKKKLNKINKNKKDKKVKKSDNKKQSQRDIKDSQKNMSDELSDTPVVKDYVIKIKYRGDGYADISVADSFISLSQSEKTTVAKKVNNFVTSYAEDFEMNEDPYCFLTFMYKGKLVGHSKQLSHNEYKWQK